MRVRLAMMLAAAMAAVAMLVPVASAQAAFRLDPWCQGVTLAPGKACTSWPLNVNSIATNWLVTKGGRGKVCVALTQWPAKTDPVSGVPGYNCNGVSYGGFYQGDYNVGHVGDDGIGAWSIYQYNPWAASSYRYGQARILNYSSATIKIQLNDGNWVRHWN
jgi:hypothetical protein